MLYHCTAIGSFAKTIVKFMRKRLVILVAAFVLLATSCKKDEEPPAVEINVQNLAGTYRISKIGVSVGGAAEEDVTRFLLEDCEKDDLLTLDPNLTYTFVDAGTTCDSSINVAGKWSLSGKDTMVFDDTTSFMIRRFDGTNLELNHTDTVNNITANYTQYFIKQQ
jgi:hypothetical protein